MSSDAEPAEAEPAEAAAEPGEAHVEVLDAEPAEVAAQPVEVAAEPAEGTMSHSYRKRPLHSDDGHVWGIILENSQGCSNLVGLHNYWMLRFSSVFGSEEATEGWMMENIRVYLELRLKHLTGFEAEDTRAARDTLAAIRREFNLVPCLFGHQEFVQNSSWNLCSVLHINLYHAWVLNPEVSCYDIIKTFSRLELEKYCKGLEEDHPHRVECWELLNPNELTLYGIDTLSAELTNDGLVLFYWRNRLDVIQKHEGALFVLVVDEEMFEQNPSACLMLLEESEEKIYFTDKYEPVKEQCFADKANDWYKKWRAKVAERKNLSKEKKKQRKNEKKMARQQVQAEVQVQALGNENVSRSKNATRNRRRKLKKKQNLKPNEEGSSDESVDDKGNSVGSSLKDSVGSSSKEQTEAEGDGGQEGAPTSASQDNSNLPEDDPSDFLRFLRNYTPDPDGIKGSYFKGMVAAFSSQAPNFYVPYDFIMEYDEPLALNIQDNYSSIYEDLRKDVVHYLSDNEVEFPHVQLYIIGLPEPKSMQLFLDFIQSIGLHEFYDIYGGDPEALPSSDFRRMALGYLAFIVSKFREGRCYNGEWTEVHMKVKNKGKQFVIDCKDDYELTADRGFQDLHKFSVTVLERLRINNKLPPYCDQFGDDIMMINKCFGNPEKWERFLQLISYPLGLKPPLVRAAFICNVYIAANANSSGVPPRYNKLFSRKDCYDWRSNAVKNELAKKVYEHQNVRKVQKWKYYLDIWSISHWHVFKFSRHFIQHVLRHTKGKDLIQKVKDISVIDILLSKTISKAIAQSVRFLVLDSGISGIFSSAWRHYTGSDYVDKQNEIPEETSGDILDELVDNVTEKKSGYIVTEVEIFSEPQHISIIISDTDLQQIQSMLKENGFQCERSNSNHDVLQSGQILLSTRCYDSEDRTVVVVEGPYSAEYDSIFISLTGWLCADH